MHPTKLRQLYVSRTTICELLKDRGYCLDGVDLMLDRFKGSADVQEEEEIKKAMTISLKKNLSRKRKEQTFVFWPIEEKLGDNIQGILEKMGVSETWQCNPKEGLTVKAIVVSDVGITPTAKGQLKALQKRGVRIDHFTLQESMINVLKGYYSSKYHIASAKEYKEIKTQYGASKKDFPSILSTDPVAKHLGIDKGTLLRVERTSITQPGHTVFHYALLR